MSKLVDITITPLLVLRLYPKESAQAGILLLL